MTKPTPKATHTCASGRRVGNSHQPAHKPKNAKEYGFPTLKTNLNGKKPAPNKELS